MSTPTLAEDRQTLLTTDGAGKAAKAAALARLEAPAKAYLFAKRGRERAHADFRAAVAAEDEALVRLIRADALNAEAAK